MNTQNTTDNMKGSRKFIRLLISAAAAVIGFIILYCCINSMRTDYAVQRQESNSAIKLGIAEQELKNAASDADTDWATYDGFIESKVKAVAYMLDNSGYIISDAENASSAGDFVNVSAAPYVTENIVSDGNGSETDTSEAAVACSVGVEDLLANIAGQWGLCTAYITDHAGNVICSFGGDAESLKAAGLDRLLKYINGEDDHPFQTIGTVCYYIAQRADGGYVTGGFESADMIAVQDERFTPEYTLRGITVGENGYIAAIDQENDLIAYAKDENLTGQPTEKLFDNEVPADGYKGWITIGGSRWYAESLDTVVDEHPYRLVALVSEAELLSYTHYAVLWSLAVYVVAVVMLMMYAHFLGSDVVNGTFTDKVRYRKLSDGRYINVTMLVKLTGIAGIAAAAVFVSAWYTQSLADVSRQRILSEAKLDAADSWLDADDTRIAQLENDFNEEYTQRAKNIAWAFAYEPVLLEEENLKAFAETINTDEIWVFDGEGRVEATNTVYKDYVLNDDPESQSYEFWDIIKGYKDAICQPLKENDVSGEMKQYIGVARADGKPGMVEIGLTPDVLAEKLATTGTANVIDGIPVENNGWLFAVSKDEQTLIYAPGDRMEGRDALDYGLNENALKDDYAGWLKVNGIYSFVMSRLHGGAELIYIAIPNATITKGCLTIAVITAVIAGILLMLITIVECLTTDVEMSRAAMKRKTTRQSAYYTVVGSDGRLMETQAAASRWSGSRTAFADCDAGEKTRRIFCTVVGAALIIAFALLKAGIISIDPDSMIGFIMSGRWEHRLNLFAVSYIIVAVAEIIVIAYVLRTCIALLTRSFGSRVETLGRLAESFVKYAAAICAVFYGLSFVGIDSATLLAGLGVLTVIVGLGANALIADIMAGIFIVFEGEFRVGDIVTIGDWRGTVEEIGIRTTKVLSPSKDIKIFRNSAISGVINMTRQYSVASIDVPVGADERLEDVEARIQADMDIIRRRIPEIAGGPYSEGLVSYAVGGAGTVRVSVLCKEADRIKVSNKLNREMKLILDKRKENETQDH